MAITGLHKSNFIFVVLHPTNFKTRILFSDTVLCLINLKIFSQQNCLFSRWVGDVTSISDILGRNCQICSNTTKSLKKKMLLPLNIV